MSVQDFAAGPLSGPGGTTADRGRLRLLLCVMPAALCIAMLAMFAGRFASLSLPDLLAWAQRVLPPAACATAVCFLLAIAPAKAGAGHGWLLPLWLAPSAGVLGWPLLPIPPGVVSDTARAIVLTLPVMVLMLTGAWSVLPAGVSRAAAAAGAPLLSRLLLRLRLAAPGALRACAVVGVLCLGLAGPRAALP